MLTPIKTLLKDSLESFHFSGYQLTWKFPFSSGSLCGGNTSYFVPQEEVTEDTFFDIGSITKIFTTTLVALKVQEKKWSIEDTWGTLLQKEGIQLTPTSFYSEIKLKELLRHSSGFIDWLPLYKELKGGLWEWFQKNEARISFYPRNSKSLYSDLNFLLIGLLFKDLKREMETKIFKPSRLAITFGPIKSPVAATEFSLEENRLIQGEVFDENARALGGIAPHAGLFSSAKSLLLFGQWWLQQPVSEFTKKNSEVPHSDFALGFDTKSKENSSCGTLMSSQTFGHLGYPGASLWIDPVEKGAIAFLTNRIHPTRLDIRIRKLRPLIHDAIMRLKK